MNLIEHLDFYQHVKPNKLFLFDERHFYSVKESFDLVSSLAIQMDEFGIRKDDMVFFSFERSTYAVLLFFSLEMVKAHALLLDPDGEEITFDESQVHYEISGGDGIFFLKDLHDNRRILFNFKRNEKVFQGQNIDEDDFDFVVFDKKGRGTKISENHLLSIVEEVNQRLAYKEGDVSLVMTSMNHIPGILQLVFAVTLQHALFIPRSLKGEDLEVFLDRFCVSRMSGTLMDYHLLIQNNLSTKKRKRHMRIGLLWGDYGEQQMKEMEKSLSVLLVPIYGINECPIISLHGVNERGWNRRRGLGKGLKDTQFLFTAQGKLRIKSSCLSKGYLDGEVMVDAEGFVKTDDPIFIDKKGNLCFPRMSDLK
jgi:hypothetical protein